jgi:hypothetical protein
MNAVLLIARKEAGEIVASRRGRAWLLMLSAALSAFGLLPVALGVPALIAASLLLRRRRESRSRVA